MICCHSRIRMRVAVKPLNGYMTKDIYQMNNIIITATKKGAKKAQHG